MSQSTVERRTPAAALDQAAGMATMAGLTVEDADEWTVCCCTDDRHGSADWLQHETWGDGGATWEPAWSRDREEVRVQVAYQGGGAHIVGHRRRVITGPVEGVPSR